MGFLRHHNINTSHALLSLASPSALRVRFLFNWQSIKPVFWSFDKWAVLKESECSNVYTMHCNGLTCMTIAKYQNVLEHIYKHLNFSPFTDTFTNTRCKRPEYCSNIISSGELLCFISQDIIQNMTACVWYSNRADTPIVFTSAHIFVIFWDSKEEKLV